MTCPARIALRAAALASLLLLGACGSLPRIVPDMRTESPEPQVVAAHGPLSAERSKQILDKLRAESPESDVLARHLALESAISESPLVAGNAVRLLQNGPATYAAMFAAIEAARDHIDMETYILDDDEVGRRFATMLIEKQRQGVQVNLIHDGVGTLDTPKEFFTPLIDAGINVLEFNPVNPLDAKIGWDVNNRDHRKLLVVDGRTAILGGINISSVYSGGSFSRSKKKNDKQKSDKQQSDKPADRLPWRDTDLQIDGPVVAEFQKLFIDTWRKQKGAPLADRNYFPPLDRRGDEVIHALGGSPDEPFSVIYATLVSAIQSAESEILLTNAYFAPDPQFIDALKAAVARGVKVSIVLPSTTDSALIFFAGRSYYDELLESGVRIYERQAVLLHAKTVLIDGVWSTIGSTNLDWRSFLHNQEINAVVLGSEFGRRMRAAFDADLAASTEITLEAWRARSPAQRLKERFSRLWRYWL